MSNNTNADSPNSNCHTDNNKNNNNNNNHNSNNRNNSYLTNVNNEDYDDPSNKEFDHNNIKPSKSKHKCEFCSLELSTNSNLHRHYKRAHQQQQKEKLKRNLELYSCVCCDRGFSNAQQLKSHFSSCKGNEPSSMKRLKTTSSGPVNPPTTVTSSTITNETVSLAVSAATLNDNPSLHQFDTNNINSYFNSSHYNATSYNNENTSMFSTSGYTSLQATSTALIPYNKIKAADLIRLNAKVIQDETLNKLAGGFFHWCGLSAVSELEKMIKHTKLITEQQLLPVKSNLRFMCNILLAKGVVEQEEDLRLSHFTRIEVISIIQDQVQSSSCKSERIYALFLLLKKLAIYLTSKQSMATSTYLLPQQCIPSYCLIETVANEHCMLRKREAKDRLCGIKPSSHQKLQVASNSHSHTPIKSFTVNSSQQDNGTAVTPDSKSSARSSSSQSNSTKTIATTSTTSSSNPSTLNATIITRQNSSSSNYSIPQAQEQIIPTKDDLTRLAKATLNYLNAVINDPISINNKLTPIKYAQFLVMSLLVFHPPPRSQVLMHMNAGEICFNNDNDNNHHHTNKTHHHNINLNQANYPITKDVLPPKTLFKENNVYILRMSSVLSKDRKPVVFQISSTLTRAFDYYFSTIRPLLLADVKEYPDVGYVFVGKNNKSKTSFCSWVSAITQEVICKRIVTHSFRHAIVSLLYEHSSNNSDTQMQKLSTIMSHSHDVAKQYYFKIAREHESNQFNKEIASILGLSGDSSIAALINADLIQTGDDPSLLSSTTISDSEIAVVNNSLDLGGDSINVAHVSQNLAVSDTENNAMMINPESDVAPSIQFEPNKTNNEPLTSITTASEPEVPQFIYGVSPWDVPVD